MSKLFTACLESDHAGIKQQCDTLKRNPKGNKASVLNWQDPQGQTPLLISCWRGDAEAVELLLEAGADVTLCNYVGASPLLMACHKGHNDCAVHCLVAGADVEGADEGGCTPMYVAALAGHFELVHSCYLAGADVNRPNASGATPLIACCGRGHAECAAVLMHAGADMATQHRGHTAMEWALEHGHMEALRVLAMRDPASIFDSGEGSPERMRLSIFRNSMPMERELPMDDDGPNVAV